MPELPAPVKDPEPDVEPCGPLTAGQVVALCAAGFVGGVVGSVALGVVGVLIGGASARGQIIETVGMKAGQGWMVGVVLGLPLGVAVGLRMAGRRLGIRGRFWPAIGASFAVALAWIGLLKFHTYLTMLHPHMGRVLGTSSPFLVYAALFVLSLIGGLAGYLLSRPRRSDDTVSNS